jgi:hypothetical protein
MDTKFWSEILKISAYLKTEYMYEDNIKMDLKKLGSEFEK